jgi:ankyrin repeat protein
MLDFQMLSRITNICKFISRPITTPIKWILEHALLYAAATDRHSMADFLLWIGVDINCRAKSSCRQTPLHLAVKQQNHKMVVKLLNKGAFVNCIRIAPFDITDKTYNVITSGVETYTPLHEAILLGDEKLVKILLKHNASLKDNIRSYAGNRSPLNLALSLKIQDEQDEISRVSIIKLLLHYGAQPFKISSPNFLSPFMDAVERNAYYIVNLFLKDAAAQEPINIISMETKILERQAHNIQLTSTEKLLVNHVNAACSSNNKINKHQTIQFLYDNHCKEKTYPVDDSLFAKFDSVPPPSPLPRMI